MEKKFSASLIALIISSCTVQEKSINHITNIQEVFEQGHLDLCFSPFFWNALINKVLVDIKKISPWNKIILSAASNNQKLFNILLNALHRRVFWEDHLVWFLNLPR